MTSRAVARKGLTPRAAKVVGRCSSSWTLFEVEAVGSILAWVSWCCCEGLGEAERKEACSTKKSGILPSCVPPPLPKGTMTVALLNHLLAHHLATNDAIPAALPYVLSVLRDEQSIAKCEQEEGLGGPVMHRWVALGGSHSSELCTDSSLCGQVEPTTRVPHRTLSSRSHSNSWIHPPPAHLQHMHDLIPIPEQDDARARAQYPGISSFGSSSLRRCHGGRQDGVGEEHMARRLGTRGRWSCSCAEDGHSSRRGSEWRRRIGEFGSTLSRSR